MKCNVCGLDKTLESKKKDGTPFMSCPNWRDAEHQKARDDYKRSKGAPQGTYNASQGSTANLNGNPDVYDLLTTIVAQNNKILEKLAQEMPSEEEF